jgi:hypothetical protein
MTKVKNIKYQIKPTDKGKLFTRKQLGIKLPAMFNSPAEVNGEKFLFFTINNDKGYKNELHSDGIVFEPDNDSVLVKGSDIFISDDYKDRRIMVRYYAKGQSAFEYIGIVKHMVRYDQTRNKIFVK